MVKKILLLFIVCFCANQLTAQKNTIPPTVKQISSSTTDKSILYYANTNEPPRAIEFQTQTVAVTEFTANLHRYFNIPKEFSFIEKESNTDHLGMRHRFLQQYFNNIEVEGMGYRVHEKNGFVTSANGKAVRSININIQTTLSEKQSFQLAVQYLQTKDTTVQRGRKLIVSKGFTFSPESFFVVYQFDIDVSLVERWRISIDARSGQVVNKVSLVNNCFAEKKNTHQLPYGTGLGLTNYYGMQTIPVEMFNNGSSLLVGQTENGGKIETYDYANASIWAWFFGFNVPLYNFYSSTNVYTEARDQTGVSVQWAADKTFEYYFKNHGRSSYDNLNGTVRLLVHVDQNLDNAFWSRNTLLFGDGSNNNPLVELDVVGHEFTHGVTQYEAALQYLNEPGALNESFSDIFGKAIEFDTFKDTATWHIAKYFRNGGLRDMSNPNSKNQPDTWKGDLWYTESGDNGGVHYNSGVQNFWYYLLCSGGSGVNDYQLDYSVNSIGMEAATNITYRNLTEYLGYFSDYLDSRIGSLLATSDLYGKNSDAYQQVANAWDAVGVVDKPIVTSLDFYDITATTVKMKGTLLPRGKDITYHFEYGTTPNYGNVSASYQYIDAVTGMLTGLQSSTKYYVKIVATNENGSSYYKAEFTTISLTPLVKIKQSVDVTKTTAILYGEINPNSLPTSYYFEYGLTPSFGLTTPTYSLQGTTEFLPISVQLSNLQTQKAYYCRLVATNGFGYATSELAYFFTTEKPKISSVAPSSATVGSEITITGENFSAVPEKNWVSFGATRAKVLSATTTLLKVKVPSGASLAPITVYDAESGLVGESTIKFVPTYVGEFQKNHLQLTAGINAPVRETLVEDMDVDGKPDIIALHYQGFSVFQNINQGLEITNESFIRNVFDAEYPLETLHAADLDGNGLKDIVSRNGEEIRIYPNLSAPGFIFFGSPVNVPIGSFFDIIFNDFDEDGRIDIAVTTSEQRQDSSTLIIFRNQNSSSIESDRFVKKFYLTLPQVAVYLDSRDLNNDGKSDLVASVNDRTFVSVLKNESTPGIMLFSEKKVDDFIKGSYTKILLQDFNQDGWADIVSYPLPGFIENMTVLENNRTSPDISMKSAVVPFGGYSTTSVQPGDINGDGKVDMLVGSDNRKFIFLKNNTEAVQPLTDLSFERFEEYGMTLSSLDVVETNLTVNDLNGDGRPEIINSNIYFQTPHDGYDLEIWQNAPPECIDPSRVDVDVSGNSVTLVLPADITLDRLEVSYKTEYDDYWYTIQESTFWVPFAGNCQLRVRAKCYLDFTEYFYKDFAVDCINTDDFSIVNIQANTVTVQAYYLNNMEVQYSPASKNQWITLDQNSYQIVNLAPGTLYDVRYRGRCITPAHYNYKQFTTLCPKLSSITVTNVRYNTADVNWTSNYAGIVSMEYSSDNLNWILVDASKKIFPLVPAQNYFVRGRIECANAQSDFLYTSFTTPCPKISGLLLNSVTPFSAQVSWTDESQTKNYSITYTIDGRSSYATTQQNSFTLNNLKPGTNCAVSVAPNCTANKEFVTLNFTTRCFAPTNLSATAITYTSAQVSWQDAFGGVPYYVDYAVSGDKKWMTIETVSTNVLLTELRPATEYEVRAHINCTNINAPYVSLLFKTSSYSETVIAPNPSEKNIVIYPAADLIGKQFFIFDSLGKQVANGELQDYTIDLSILSSGIYYLTIEGSRPIKFVKL
jgi:Zn-dependent metalloprotease